MAHPPGRPAEERAKPSRLLGEVERAAATPAPLGTPNRGPITGHDARATEKKKKKTRAKAPRAAPAAACRSEEGARLAVEPRRRRLINADWELGLAGWMDSGPGVSIPSTNHRLPLQPSDPRPVSSLSKIPLRPGPSFPGRDG